jgi:ATP-binding cassette subfamily F protein 3
MAFIQGSGISLAFADRDILRDVSIHLKSGDKAALCGANGAGKTTLLKILSGSLAPSDGSLVQEKNSTLAYLPQSGIVCAGKTLEAELDSVFDEYRLLFQRAEALREELACANGEAHTAKLLAEHDALFEAQEDSPYLQREKEISRVREGLGFTEADMPRDCAEFSGGWQMRVALAKTLLKKPDILILDEPTNYLDIEARLWLLRWLKSFSGALLIVSHDRYFLDMLVTAVYELFAGKLKRYSGNFSEYEKTRRRELESLAARYKAQQAEIARLEKLVERFRYKASKAAFAQEQVKKLEKMERIELPAHVKNIHISFPPPPPHGRVVLTAKNLEKTYGDFRVIEKFDLVLEAGERLVCAGVNGAGKSTLLRLFSGADTGFSGKLRLGTGVSAGYYSQDAAERLRGGAAILDYVQSRAPQVPRSQLRDALGSFLFQGDAVLKPVDVLSGGEKSRLALLELLLSPHNLLILDEPTNHLDIYAKDVLLAALRSWKGTCVFVSHDRAFIEGLATKTLELCAGHAPRLFFGGYRYYLEKTGMEAAASTAVSQTRTAQAALKTEAALSREQKKQLQGEERRRAREESALFERIAGKEAEKAALEAELAQPEVYSAGEKSRAVQARIAACAEEIATMEAAWEALRR